MERCGEKTKLFYEEMILVAIKSRAKKMTTFKMSWWDYQNNQVVIDGKVIFLNGQSKCNVKSYKKTVRGNIIAVKGHARGNIGHRVISDLFFILNMNRDRPIVDDDLISFIYSDHEEEPEYAENSLRVSIHNFRKSEVLPPSVRIETVRGHGYKLIVDNDVKG